MVLRCVRCGKEVSDKIPDSTKVSAWIECRDCVNKEVFENRIVFQQLTIPEINIKMFEFFMRCKFNNLDMDKLKQQIDKSYNQAMTSKFSKEGYFSMLNNDAGRQQIMKDQENSKKKAS